MEIRKTDAKGRLTGFFPRQYYFVQGEKYDLRARRIDDLDDVLTSVNIASQKARDYLESLGLDMHRVSREGMCYEGYAEFVLDSEGKRVDDYGANKTVRKPWPEGFNWDLFVEMLVDEETEPA